MTLQDVCSIRAPRQATDKKSMSGHCWLNLKGLALVGKFKIQHFARRRSRHKLREHFILRNISRKSGKT